MSIGTGTTRTTVTQNIYSFVHIQFPNSSTDMNNGRLMDYSRYYEIYNKQMTGNREYLLYLFRPVVS